MMDENRKEAAIASTFFMCSQYPPHGCLECRTHRLLIDIRSGLYEKMSAEQNRAEWGERAIEAEKELAALKESAGKLADDAEAFLAWGGLGDHVHFGGRGEMVEADAKARCQECRLEASLAAHRSQQKGGGA